MALCSTCVVPAKLRTKDRPPKTQPPARPVPARPGPARRTVIYIPHQTKEDNSYITPVCIQSHHVWDYLISTLAIQHISLATFYTKHYLYQNYFRSHKTPHIHLKINTTSKHV